MIEVEKIPLFPLNLVLFPGTRLPLQIFEPRYTDLVSECLKADSGFGICCIREGGETGEHASCFDTGTFVRIIDWSQLDNGLLGITVEAKKRFRVQSYSRRENSLLEGEITWLEDENGGQISEKYHALRDFMARVFDHYEITFDEDSYKINEPLWLGYRLAEYLPLAVEEKQALLELADSEQRLQRIQQMLEENNFDYGTQA